MPHGGSALLPAMKNIQRIIAGLLLATIVAPVSAQQLESELTLFGAYRFGGEISVENANSNAVYKADDAPSYGLIWNTQQKANTQWEVYFSRQETQVELSDPLLASPEVDIEQYTLQLGGTYLWDRSKGVQPYLAMTIGGTHIKADAGNGDSDTFVSGSLGLGLKIRPGERLGFRLEGRLHGVLVNDSTELFCQTGPDLNFCAVRVQGSLFSQFEIFGGISFRF
jgi:opacity protein-like surface antigen